MNEDKFKKAIESCHLNFLIGSGASRNYFETLGNVENLLTNLSNQPKTDERLIVEASIKNDYFKKGILGNLGFIDSKKIINTADFENTSKNYQEFLIALNVILLRRRSNLIGRQVNLFTTNIDLFLDRTLEEMGLEYNDGFLGKLQAVFSTSNYRKSVFQKSPHYENKAELPLFNLFKLHGSVTWKQDNDKILFDSNLSVVNEIANSPISGKTIDDFLDDKENAKTVQELQKEAEALTYEISLKNFNDSYDKLLIINPTKEKFITTTVQYTFYELLRMYSNELEKENSLLFVFGFSFADEHIREITKRVANSNPTLLVSIFAYDDKSKLEIEAKLNMQDFKFRNVEIITVGDLASINNNWFSKLAKELDEELFQKKKNDLVVNVTLPPPATV